jgi:hypothetical protein
MAVLAKCWSYGEMELTPISDGVMAETSTQGMAMSQITPEARAITDKANRAIFASVEQLKRRQRKNGITVTKTLATSVALRIDFQNAKSNGDVAYADALRFCSAGFLSAYMERKSQPFQALMIAVLLAHREKPAEGPWCQGILDAMTEIGFIGPNH